VCFICYTIKGHGLPFAGHKDNHAGLMTAAQMGSFRQAMNIRSGHEWDRFEGLSEDPQRLQRFLDKVPFAGGGERRLRGPPFPAPAFFQSRRRSPWTSI
jgi:pyruvate dehydrogenase E1 component